MEKKKCILKVLLLGDFGVGKTSLIQMFANKKFSEKSLQQTAPLETVTKEYNINNQIWNISFNIWDTAGQEKHDSLAEGFFRDSDCCFLVYDTCNPTSFENLEKWKEKVIKTRGIPPSAQFPIIVLGNKSDKKSESKVGNEEAKSWVEKNKIQGFYLTSAKDNANLEEAFQEIAKIKEKPEEGIKTQRIQIGSGQKKKKEGGCCS